MIAESLVSGYGLVEGPVWDQELGLIFSDVLFGGVYSLDTRNNVRNLFEHRRGIGGMAFHVAGGIVVSGRNVSFKPFGSNTSRLLLDRDEANDNVGYNDLTTDSQGRIYVGSLGSSPVFEDGRGPVAGNLYVIDLDGTSRIVAEDVQLTNGLGFSPDGSTLYHSDSRRQQVMCYETKSNGDLGVKQVFVEFDEGAPDGLAVATDGSIWVANAGAGCVNAFDPEGKHITSVAISVPMCTSVCFGGPNLESLYVVSGSNGVEGDRRGGAYICDVGVAGLPVPMATTRLQ